MTEAHLVVSPGPHGTVWRVGYRPDPWTWPDWKWASDGHFHGRWDDRTGTFRTLYVAESLVACLLEVLASLRPDPVVTLDLEAIEEDPQDALDYPTTPAGEVTESWLDSRCAGKAELTGDYCRVTAAESVATLRPRFIGFALRLGRRDFDVSALKDGATRVLTQAVSTFLCESTTLDGIEFASRLGDDMRMWAIFERPGDLDVSPRLRGFAPYELEQSSPELAEAFQLLGLRWRECVASTRPTPQVLERSRNPGGWGG